MALLIVSLLLLLVIGFIVLVYNRLVKAKNIVNEAFSGIDVQLQKRFELIPNIVKAVKGYNQYEADTLQKVVEKRNPSGKNVDQAAENDKAVTQQLRHFKIQVEDYPDLKSSEQFLKLMDQLSKVENELAMSRRYYNGTARVFNTQLQVFPNNLMASIFGFKEVPFYAFEGDDRSAPEVELKSES